MNNSADFWAPLTEIPLQKVGGTQESAFYIITIDDFAADGHGHTVRRGAPKIKSTGNLSPVQPTARAFFDGKWKVREQKLRWPGCQHECIRSRARYTEEKSLTYRVICSLTALQKHLPGLKAFSEDWKGRGDIQKVPVPAKLKCTHVRL